jgi:hypothetical protein
VIVAGGRFGSKRRGTGAMALFGRLRASVRRALLKGFFIRLGLRLLGGLGGLVSLALAALEAKIWFACRDGYSVKSGLMNNAEPGLELLLLPTYTKTASTSMLVRVGHGGRRG